MASVRRMRARLDRIYAGRPAPEPVDRALADAVVDFAVPRVSLEALLEGLEWDVGGRSYESLDDLYAYCARVAGSVGAMMATLMGARTAAQVARACDLGVAMQLTNIARDVGEDARAGRLYLPRAWLRESGVDPAAWLAQPVYRPEIGQVVARLLACADGLYRRADAGIATLDPAFRPAIFAARHLYAEIGTRLSAQGLDSVSTRTRVPVWRKVQLLALAVARARRASAGGAAAAALPQTQFLVEAVIREPAWPGQAAEARRRGPGDDLVWTLDLFARLETRERRRGPGRAAEAPDLALPV